MKRGAFMLAAAAARPIVCLTVLGAHERMPFGSPFVRHGRVRVIFSRLIATDGESARRLAVAVAETFRATLAPKVASCSRG